MPKLVGPTLPSSWPHLSVESKGAGATPKSAFAISDKWNKSKIKILNTAGHSSSDNGIIENLVESIEEIKEC